MDGTTDTEPCGASLPVLVKELTAYAVGSFAVF